MSERWGNGILDAFSGPDEIAAGDGEAPPTAKATAAAPAAAVLPEGKPHRCPVCTGTGGVPCGFYGLPVSNITNGDHCRSCGGTGIVWSAS